MLIACDYLIDGSGLLPVRAPSCGSCGLHDYGLALVYAGAGSQPGALRSSRISACSRKRPSCWREDEPAVREHVVLALLALLDLGLVLGLGVQLGRETRGPRVDCLDGAVLDQDARPRTKNTVASTAGRRMIESVSSGAEIVAWTCFVVGIVLLFTGVLVGLALTFQENHERRQGQGDATA